MYRLGVATSAELEALRVYFDSVAVEADKLQQQWAARNDPVWVVVSSPEFLHTGERVMEWIQEACERQPWRLKQGFDWATSGNRRARAAIRSVSPAAWDACCALTDAAPLAAATRKMTPSGKPWLRSCSAGWRQ